MIRYFLQYLAPIQWRACRRLNKLVAKQRASFEAEPLSRAPHGCSESHPNGEPRVTASAARVNAPSALFDRTAVYFSVPGVPVAKARPRITTRGGKVRSFTPPTTVAFESRVALAAEKAMEGADPISGPVCLTLWVQLPIAQSWSGKKKAAALESQIRPCSRPDLDNYIKSISDGGNGVLWNDDAQIVQLIAFKHYAENPGVQVEVRAL
jgi:Holliday junction resolvase RusA-like endonuclease